MPSGELFALVLPSVAHLRLCRGDSPPPLNSVMGAMGSYPELCAKCNLYLCPFVIRISENRTASLVGHLPILRVQFEHSNSLCFWFFIFSDNGTCVQLVYYHIFDCFWKFEKVEKLRSLETRLDFSHKHVNLHKFSQKKCVTNLYYIGVF